MTAAWFSRSTRHGRTGHGTPSVSRLIPPTVAGFAAGNCFGPTTSRARRAATGHPGNTASTLSLGRTVGGAEHAKPSRRRC